MLFFGKPGVIYLAVSCLLSTPFTVTFGTLISPYSHEEPCLSLVSRRLAPYAGRLCLHRMYKLRAVHNNFHGEDQTIEKSTQLLAVTSSNKYLQTLQ